jgi:hypothetical protein
MVLAVAQRGIHLILAWVMIGLFFVPMAFGAGKSAEPEELRHGPGSCKGSGQGIPEG